MRPMDGEISLVEPIPGTDELTPGSSCDLVFEYTNTGPDAHYVESIYLEPTWHLSERRIATIETEVPAGMSRELTTVRTDIPEGLTGRHGFRTGVEARPLANGAEPADGLEAKTVWMDSVRRFEVAESDGKEPTAIVCFSEGHDEYQLINQLLKDYGYNPDFVESHDELLSKEQPALVLGVVLSEATDLVSSTLTWAVPDEVDGSFDIDSLEGSAPGNLLIQHRTVSLGDEAWPAMVHEEIETVDRLAVERAIGQYLFKLQLLDEGCILEYVYELADALQTDPKNLIDSWSTDQIIEAIEATATRDRIIKILTAGTGFVAGSEVGAADTETTPELLEYLEREGGHWAIELNDRYSLAECLDELGGLLVHSDADIRVDATEQLADIVRNQGFRDRVVDSAVFPVFVDRLEDDAPAVRTNAASGCRWIAPYHPEAIVKTDGVGALTDTLGDESPRTREYAAMALGRVAREYPSTVVEAGALPMILDLIDSEESKVRKAAVYVFAEVAADHQRELLQIGALPKLVDSLEDDDSNESPTRAVADIARKYPRRVVEANAVPPLVASLDNALERGYAAYALEMVAEEYPDVVVRAGALEPLVELLDKENGSTAAAALGVVAKEYPKQVITAGALPKLTDQLDDSDKVVNASYALVGIAEANPKAVMRTTTSDGTSVLKQLARMEDEDSQAGANAAVTLSHLSEEYPESVKRARRQYR